MVLSVLSLIMEIYVIFMCVTNRVSLKGYKYAMLGFIGFLVVNTISNMIGVGK